MSLTGWPDSWLPDRLLGRLSHSQIAGKRPSGVGRRSCCAYPLGIPAGSHEGGTAGRKFCDPRTSCGDTNGSTLHVAKQVRGIQHPQSCRQAHRISRFPSAPLLASTLLKPTNDHGLCLCVKDGLSLSTGLVACHSKSGAKSDRRVTNCHH